jgi:predicted GNAT superfamily acetyltransferase
MPLDRSATPLIRAARPQDYDRIAAVVDDWWGRELLGLLPRLFLDHFHDTSLVAESDGVLAGFLVGFLSPAQPEGAYIHFVGVAPQLRGRGLARRMYSLFFVQAQDAGATWVEAVTGPVNTGSIAFHRALGFSVEGPVPGYDGPGRDLMHFRRLLRGAA